MTSQCRACLDTICDEFIHLGTDFTEEQTYFDCFNECTQLAAAWDDDLPQVICQICLNTLNIAFDFIKTAQKSDFILRSRLKNKPFTSKIEPQQNEMLQVADIENMEILVLESLAAPTLKEHVLDHYNYLISEDDESQLEPKQSSQLTCQICNVFFEQQTQLEQHLYDEHDEVESNAGFIALATCEICHRTFESNENLELHKLIFHQSTISSTCMLCNEPIETDFEHISEHISMQHPIEYEKLFKNLEEISNNDTDEELVEDCRTNGNDAANVNCRVDPETNNSTIFEQCTICNEKLLQNDLEQHMSKHIKLADEEKQFLCSFCPREFQSQKALQQHRKNTHKLREYCCNFCGNAFKLKNQLNNHMKLHLQKNISCPHCDKKYARPFDLNVHLRSHTGAMPYECHLCEKKFAIKVRLTYHLQKHYGIKHNCKECGAQFNSKTKLKAHSFKHTGMPYRCELCDDHGFPNRDVFKRHLLRVHNATITEEDLLDMFQRNTGKSTRIREVNALTE